MTRFSINTQHNDTQCNGARAVTLSVANKPFMLGVVMLKERQNNQGVGVVRSLFNRLV